MIEFLAAVEIAAASGGPAVWSNADVAAFVASKPTAAPLDPFSPAPVSALDGQAFRLTFALRQKQGHSGGPFTWEYDITKQRMKFSLLPEMFIGTAWSRDEDISDIRTFTSLGKSGFTLERNEKVEDGGRRSNAFGASVDVTTTTITEISVVEFASSYETPSPFSDRYFLQADVSASPEEGRLMTTDVQVVVYGKLKAFEGRTPVICGSDYHEPSVSNPRETIVRTCAAVVDVTRIALENSSTGEIVTSWGN